NSCGGKLFRRFQRRARRLRRSALRCGGSLGCRRCCTPRSWSWSWRRLVAIIIIFLAARPQLVANEVARRQAWLKEQIRVDFFIEANTTGFPGGQEPLVSVMAHNRQSFAGVLAPDLI